MSKKVMFQPVSAYFDLLACALSSQKRSKQVKIYHVFTCVSILMYEVSVK